MVYQNFAYFYDELMSHAPYDQWTQLTKDVIDENGLIEPSIVDLGCGTGEITLRLTGLSKNITGVDYSAEMLAVAMNKATEQQKHINWVQQDIKELTGFKNVDLMISYCDVINYLTTTDDVDRVFKHVYHSLNNSGVFVFDIHSQEYILENFIGKTFADVSEDTAYIWDCYSGDKLGAMEHEITFFVKNQNETYKKIIENHFQQVFTKDFYLESLEKAGFKDIKIRANFDLKTDKLTKEVDRFFIIAKK